MLSFGFMVTAAVGWSIWPLYPGSNSKLDINATKIAFISMIDIVFPMHACGPVINDNKDREEL
jgi:hypothetical protein